MENTYREDVLRRLRADFPNIEEEFLAVLADAEVKPLEPF